MSRKLQDDCFLHDEDRLSHDKALAILRERVAPIVSARHVAVADASGRMLAEKITAPRDIPAHTNAAVDGYAFAFSDYNEKKGRVFRAEGRIAAGHASKDPLVKGTASRIFTGGAMPKGADTVVMQEDTEARERDGSTWVAVPGGLKQGANCRLAGEDVKVGTVILEPGCRLRPQDIAAAAAAGRDKLACFDPLRVAVYSTGDEIVRTGTALGEGQVYDANAPMLRSLIEVTGAECIDMGILPDDPDAVRASLQAAAVAYDVVVTSGGASRGEEDHIIEAMDALGSLHMWQIAVKPGRPMAFGQIDDGMILGLPGNPVAVFVCFLLYVRPVLVRLGGGTWPTPRRYPLKSNFSVAKKKTGRREFWRGLLTSGGNGTLMADKFPRDGSGLISGLCEADGLIEIAEDAKSVKKGESVAFIPFSEFGIRRA